MNITLVSIVLSATYAYVAFIYNFGEIAFSVGQAIHYALSESQGFVGQTANNIYVASTQGFGNFILDSVSMLGLIVYTGFFTVASLAAGAVVKVLSSLAGLLRRR